MEATLPHLPRTTTVVSFFFLGARRAGLAPRSIWGGPNPAQFSLTHRVGAVSGFRQLNWPIKYLEVVFCVLSKKKKEVVFCAWSGHQVRHGWSSRALQNQRPSPERSDVRLDCPFNQQAQQLFIRCSPFTPPVFLLMFFSSFGAHIFSFYSHAMLSDQPPACCMHMHATDAPFFLFFVCFYLVFSFVLISFLSFLLFICNAPIDIFLFICSQR